MARGGKRKQNNQQEYQNAINEMEDMKTTKRKELMSLNFGIRCKHRNKKQKLMSQTIKSNRITFVSGPPGTGKTLIALKTGLELIKNSDIPIESMVLSTPIIEVSPKSVGALPGDLEDKIGNYFSHFYSNIDKLVGKEVTSFLSKTGLVSQKIVNFMRGDTFGRYDEEGNAIGEYCIMDEAQNLTMMELKTFISRMGENSKLIIMGDPEQCDLNLRGNEINALNDAITRFDGMNGIGFIEFTEDEIVRDPFLIEIMKKYKD